MNFGAVLHTALKNDKQNAKKEIRYYSTKFEPPKKEQRSKTLSVNVQKFLARKEEEERKKAQEAQKRMEKLLELRSQDKKASRRVNVMLKRTKSANQSVIQDAVDRDNTAVTLAGPSQPDEDDYGYVSQNAADFYNKMMEKYSSMPPEEPKFPTVKKKVSTNLNSTKDRVKAALEREKEEAMQPHRRKRKHHKEDGETDGNAEAPEKYESEPVEKEEKKPSKPKIKPAPVINFADLLKIAEKKQFEPIVIEQKEKEEERLYTKRQKKELEKEREYRERREQRLQQGSQPPPPVNKIPKTAETENRTPKAQSEHRIPKSNGDVRAPKSASDSRPSKASNFDDKNFKVPREVDDRPRPKQAQPLRADDRSKAPPNRLPQKRPSDNHVRPSSDKPNSRDQILQNALEGKRDPKDRKQYVEITKPRPPPMAADSRPKQQIPSRPKPVPSAPRQPPPPTKQVELKRKLPPPSNAGKPKQFPPSDLKPKQFPPPDLKPKQFPPRDVYRPSPKKKPLISKGRFYDDDEDEDSEMDDFIDDGPEEGEDYSKYISEIFGYDKKKYSYVDDDVDDMESSFAQQMREEVISTKIGIMEDLEDMRQEEEQKKKKAMMKKRLNR